MVIPKQQIANACDKICNNLAVVHLCAGSDLPCLSELGKVTVQELNWTFPEQYAATTPPFDFVLAADCVYHEELVESFFAAVMAMVTTKTTGNEVFTA